MRRTAPVLHPPEPSTTNELADRDERRRAERERVDAEVTAYMESPQFLNDAMWLNHNFVVQEIRPGEPHPDLRRIHDELFYRSRAFEPRNLAQKLTDISLLVANLALARYYKRPLCLWMDRNKYSPNDEFAQYSRASYFLPECVLKMAPNPKERPAAPQWLKRLRGDERIGKVTRIFTTVDTDAYWLCNVERFPVVYRAAQLVQLRDENRRPLRYAETDLTHELRALLDGLNDLNNNHHITYGTKDLVLNPNLHCVFNRSFDEGGRFYGSGTSHQGIPSELRHTILINSVKTGELDFSAIHLRLLYAREGIEFEGDPYNLLGNPFWNMFDGCRPRGRWAGRSVGKIVALISINAKNEHAAVAAIVKRIEKSILEAQLRLAEYQANIKPELNPDHMGVAAPDENGLLEEEWEDFLYFARMILPDQRRRVVKGLVRAFIAHHAPIQKYFHTGIGSRLMNLDARICWRVCKQFLFRLKPILPIHDGFVVQVHDERLLRRVMEDAYSEVTGGFTCPVKKTRPRPVRRIPEE